MPELHTTLTLNRNVTHPANTTLSVCPFLQAALMLFNAAAILNEQRFLEKCENRFGVVDYRRFNLLSARQRLCHFVLNHFADGWGFSQLGSHPVGEGPGALKHQIIGTLHAATYMRGGYIRSRPQTHPPTFLSFYSLRISCPNYGNQRLKI